LEARYPNELAGSGLQSPSLALGSPRKGAPFVFREAHGVHSRPPGEEASAKETRQDFAGGKTPRVLDRSG